MGIDLSRVVLVASDSLVDEVRGTSERHGCGASEAQSSLAIGALRGGSSS